MIFFLITAIYKINGECVCLDCFNLFLEWKISCHQICCLATTAILTVLLCGAFKLEQS